MYHSSIFTVSALKFKIRCHSSARFYSVFFLWSSSKFVSNFDLISASFHAVRFWRKIKHLNISGVISLNLNFSNSLVDYPGKSRVILILFFGRFKNSQRVLKSEHRSLNIFVNICIVSWCEISAEYLGSIKLEYFSCSTATNLPNNNCTFFHLKILQSF